MSGPQSLDDVLRDIGVSQEDFTELVNHAGRLHEVAQRHHMNFLTEAARMGVGAIPALLAMYQIARFQVGANIAEGTLTHADVRGAKVMMEWLMELRHRDGPAPKLRLNQDGTFTEEKQH